VEEFLAKHADKITGTLACFDRINFKGYLPLNWAKAMEKLLTDHGLLIKDFKGFVAAQSQRVVEHAKAFAEEAGRPYRYLYHNLRKEDAARDIAQRDGVSEGLVCVFAAIEPCQSFAMVPGKGRPHLAVRRRKCRHLYYYFIHSELGFLHVRIQTWFPFAIQVCVNGHEVLAKAMDREGIAYRRIDNAFVWIEAPEAAQALANRIGRRPWLRLLTPFARTVNPLLGDILGRRTYYWITDPSEFSLDVLFTSRAALAPLYERLMHHATLCFSAEDVLTFLGRKLHPAFAGEVLNDYKRRWPGTRLKHRMKENWIKVYDKHATILRIEVVINRPREFKTRRWGTRNGQRVLDWYPMPKGVRYLPLYAKASFAAVRRYLDALAIVDDPAPAQAGLRALTRRVRRNGLPPDPERGGLTWGEFLAREGDVLLCADLFTKEIWTSCGLQRACASARPAPSTVPPRPALEGEQQPAGKASSVSISWDGPSGTTAGRRGGRAPLTRSPLFHACVSGWGGRCGCRGGAGRLRVGGGCRRCRGRGRWRRPTSRGSAIHPPRA